MGKYYCRGRFNNAGTFLKAKALGADAVYTGTIALMALLHTQLMKALPLEPATQIALYTGVLKEELDIDKATENLANFIHSCQEEIRMVCYALGKTSVLSVNRSDLSSVDRDLAATLCRVHWSYRSVFEPAEHELETGFPIGLANAEKQEARFLQ